jgi:hypothetical protein
MPARLHQYCRDRGCTERTNDRSGYCSKHQGNNSYLRTYAERDAARKADPVWRLYHCVQWTKRFRDAFFSYGNVICQRIVDGERCRQSVEILHHILSPKQRPDLMYTPSNIRGVCRQHHPPTEGEPKENLERLGEIYAPTIWKQLKFR